MIRIKVEYDAYNRKFKLLDGQFGPMLDDGGVYELSLPLSSQHVDLNFIGSNLLGENLVSFPHSDAWPAKVRMR